MSKGKWPELDYLSLGFFFKNADKCQIKDKGGFFLGKLQAPLLKRLDLGRYIDMETKTNLERKDAKAFLKGVGRYCKFCI